MESELLLTPREKSPVLEKFSPDEDGTYDAARVKQDNKPDTLPTELFWLHTVKLIRPSPLSPAACFWILWAVFGVTLLRVLCLL